MNDKNVRTLEKLIGHIGHTLEYCDGQAFADFAANRMLQEACVFNVMQVGELARHGFDAAFVQAHPELPWREMSGLRNRIVHDYEGIQMRMIRETIAEDFPALLPELKKIRDGVQKGGPRS